MKLDYDRDIAGATLENASQIKIDRLIITSQLQGRGKSVNTTV